MRYVPWLLLAGCFNPDLGGEPFLCGVGGACPPGYGCDAPRNVCSIAPGSGGGPDADPADSSLPLEDAADPPPDADVPDAACTDETCPKILPSNLTMASCSTSADDDLKVTAGNTMNLATDTAICDVVQPGTPALCIVVVRRFEVEPGATLTASGSRALVVLALDEVRIAGVVDVGAIGATAGPGGTSAAASGDKGAAASVRNAGGGGGHAAFGGTGAGTGGTAGGMAGEENLSPLVAAGRGGQGSGGAGGGGNGGLVQLVGCHRVVITGTAILDAPGGGGGGGAGTTLLNLPSGGGGGGGAGGGILVEGREVTVDSGALLSANGGGGGEGGVSQTLGAAVNGEGGQRGQRGLGQADGGDSAGIGAGDGGRGAAAAGAVEGGFAATGQSGHGGGGGAMGRIVINVGPGRPLTLTGVMQSPPAHTGVLLEE